MAKKSKSVNFNKVWVKTKSKTEFIKTFEKVYPELDLGAEYDKIAGKPKKEKKEEEKPQEEAE